MSFFPLFNFGTTVEDANTECHSDRFSYRNMRREVKRAFRRPHDILPGLLNAEDSKQLTHAFLRRRMSVHYRSIT